MGEIPLSVGAEGQKGCPANLRKGAIPQRGETVSYRKSLGTKSWLFWSNVAIRIMVKMGDVEAGITIPQNFKCYRESGSTVENETKGWDFKKQVFCSHSSAELLAFRIANYCIGFLLSRQWWSKRKLFICPIFHSKSQKHFWPFKPARSKQWKHSLHSRRSHIISGVLQVMNCNPISL